MNRGEPLTGDPPAYLGLRSPRELAAWRELLAAGSFLAEDEFAVAAAARTLTRARWPPPEMELPERAAWRREARAWLEALLIDPSRFTLD